MRPRSLKPAALPTANPIEALMGFQTFKRINLIPRQYSTCFNSEHTNLFLQLLNIGQGILSRGDGVTMRWLLTAKYLRHVRRAGGGLREREREREGGERERERKRESTLQTKTRGSGELHERRRQIRNEYGGERTEGLGDEM